MDYTITLSAQELQLILYALSRRPLGDVIDLFMRLRAQVETGPKPEGGKHAPSSSPAEPD